MTKLVRAYGGYLQPSVLTFACKDPRFHHRSAPFLGTITKAEKIYAAQLRSRDNNSSFRAASH
jgi:hypothetical protein